MNLWYSIYTIRCHNWLIFNLEPYMSKICSGKLWVGKHLEAVWSDKQHLEASYLIMEDQHPGDLERFTIAVFPEHQILKLGGPLLACPFLRVSETGRSWATVCLQFWKHAYQDRCKVWPRARWDPSPSNVEIPNLCWPLKRGKNISPSETGV